MALKHHPDKNGNTTESNEKFQKINEAYTYLKSELNLEENHFHTENDDDESNSSLYNEILKGFMKSVFEGKYTEILSKIVNDIITAGKKTSVKLFDDLDKDTALNIYTFLSNNRSVLHLSQEILEVIREIVVKKYDNVDVYKLNPSINDILNNNLYKLYVHDDLVLRLGGGVASPACRGLALGDTLPSGARCGLSVRPLHRVRFAEGLEFFDRFALARRHACKGGLLVSIGNARRCFCFDFLSDDFNR
jgi:curved DNA-binding protein CbpA